MAKVVKGNQFEPFALMFETLEEAATALALLNFPISSPGPDGNVMEWVDGEIAGRKRFTGTNGKKVEAADAATTLWWVVASELEAQGFYHGRKGTE